MVGGPRILHPPRRLQAAALCQIRPELDSEHKSSSYVCVRVDILEGRYDKELKWDRGFEVALSLLNQQADNHHFVKTLRGVLLRFQGEVWRGTL